jgi:hypothetical protein
MRHDERQYRDRGEEEFSFNAEPYVGTGNLVKSLGL